MSNDRTLFGYRLIQARESLKPCHNAVRIDNDAPHGSGRPLLPGLFNGQAQRFVFAHRRLFTSTLDQNCAAEFYAGADG